MGLIFEAKGSTVRSEYGRARTLPHSNLTRPGYDRDTQGLHKPNRTPSLTQSPKVSRAIAQHVPMDTRRPSQPYETCALMLDRELQRGGNLWR
jgi:hypothetical protein